MLWGNLETRTEEEIMERAHRNYCEFSEQLSKLVREAKVAQPHILSRLKLEVERVEGLPNNRDAW